MFSFGKKFMLLIQNLFEKIQICLSQRRFDLMYLKGRFSPRFTLQRIPIWRDLFRMLWCNMWSIMFQHVCYNIWSMSTDKCYCSCGEEGRAATSSICQYTNVIVVVVKKRHMWNTMFQNVCNIWPWFSKSILLCFWRKKLVQIQ